MLRRGIVVPRFSKHSTTGEIRPQIVRKLIGKFKGLAFAALLLTALVIGCGSDTSSNGDAATDSTESQTRSFDRPDILSGNDLVALGLKSGKEYDIETLTGAVEARLLFWRVLNKAVEYEARFYESHAAAIDLGTAPAEEGSGEDAILDSDKAEYTEGIKDRRTIFDFRGTVKPKYGAYAIYANMVVLCEGRDDAEAWDRCSALIQALDNQ